MAALAGLLMGRVGAGAGDRRDRCAWRLAGARACSPLAARRGVCSAAFSSLSLPWAWWVAQHNARARRDRQYYYAASRLRRVEHRHRTTRSPTSCTGARLEHRVGGHGAGAVLGHPHARVVGDRGGGAACFSLSSAAGCGVARRHPGGVGDGGLPRYCAVLGVAAAATFSRRWLPASRGSSSRARRERCNVVKVLAVVIGARVGVSALGPGARALEKGSTWPISGAADSWPAVEPLLEWIARETPARGDTHGQPRSAVLPLHRPEGHSRFSADAYSLFYGRSSGAGPLGTAEDFRRRLRGDRGHLSGDDARCGI